jgi:hypothetical protein
MEDKPKPKRRTHRLELFREDAPLSKAERTAILRKIRREHCHTIGRYRPRSCTGKCYHRNGYYVGHGVCLLFRLVERDEYCEGCVSPEIALQITFLLSLSKKHRDVEARWIKK